MEKLYNTKLINDYLKENKMSKTAFCKQCKISDELLKRFYEHLKISSVHLFKIARQLNVSIPNLFIC